MCAFIDSWLTLAPRVSIRLLIFFTVLLALVSSKFAYLDLKEKLEIGGKELEKGKKQLTDGWRQYHRYHGLFLTRSFFKRDLLTGFSKLKDGEKKIADGETMFVKGVFYLNLIKKLSCVILLILAFLTAVEILMVGCLQL